MKTKEEIVLNWLPRYTGTPLEAFGQYILLTNFKNYVDMFAEKFNVEILGQDRPMQTATANNITIINLGWVLLWRQQSWISFRPYLPRPFCF
jgi:AMP nucleosidase